VYHVYILTFHVITRHGIVETLLSSSTPSLATRDVESFLCQGHDSKLGIYDRDYGTS
jgi:hypothetical protein